MAVLLGAWRARRRRTETTGSGDEPAAECTIGWELRRRTAMRIELLSASAALVLAVANAASAGPIVFSRASATFNQVQGGYDFSPPRMIDGVTTGTNGWAISTLGGGPTSSQTALFRLAKPLASGPRTITFKIYQNWGSSETLGDFSLGYTTALSPTLNGPQTPFNLTEYSSSGGTTFTSPSPGQLLAGGANPDRAVYNITVTVSAPITGIYLNAIHDPGNGFPTGGPGRSIYNDGNFVVTQLVASTSAASKPSGN
jgi:hypothetical protein